MVVKYIELTNITHHGFGGPKQEKTICIPAGQFWITPCDEGGCYIHFFTGGLPMLVNESYEYVLTALTNLGHAVRRLPEEEEISAAS